MNKKIKSLNLSKNIIIPTYILLLFHSAFLMFLIQPMFTKLVLPKLGGAPAVWSIGMVVFQGLLLAGYFYAHLLTRYVSMRKAILIHLAVVISAAFALPVGLATGFGAPPPDGQAIWLFGFYLASIGAPFFALAGNGPLLQAWFAKSGNAFASNPYFLYAASNLGSFVALLAYPIMVEPLVSLSVQTKFWSIGFIALIGMIVLAGILVWQRPIRASKVSADLPVPPALKQRFLWVLLSFVPSALMVAVTAHISTDIAAAPFLWVIPLLLYLLTFIVVFKDKPLCSTAFLESRIPLYAIPLGVIYAFDTSILLFSFLLNLGFFFVVTLSCHLRLYQTRPSPAYLTDFYLSMSFGGVLGGVFSALLAPMLFNYVLEYPLLLILAVFLAAFFNGLRMDNFKNTLLPIFSIVLLFFIVIYYSNFYSYISSFFELPVRSVILLGLFLLTLCALAFSRKPQALAVFLPLIFLYSGMFKDDEGGKIAERSFFGVHKIGLAEGGLFRVLHHGTTMHGAMQIKSATGEPLPSRPIPLTYYNPNGSIAQSLASVPSQPQGRRIGVVGLGTGAHSCNGQPNDQWSFFEIDPVVVKIAQNPAYFRFLAECAPNGSITIGDARITLAEQPKRNFDYLLIDAFSSDAIPMHLLTVEAIKLYLSVLKEDGVLALHISNRHLELASVVAALAVEAGIPSRIKFDKTPEGVSAIFHSSSEVVVMTHSAEALSKLDALSDWSLLKPTGTPPWRDDFSNILSALWRHYAKR